ncbi:MAG: DUF2125 domain-containing protein [Rhizomicrobium sp.]
MNYSHRFFLYGPVGLFAILMLGVMGYWWVASTAMSHKLDAINGHAIAPGITVSFAHKTMSGFPFRVDTELDGFRVQVATSHGPTTWTSEHFAAHALTYDGTHFIFEAAGRQNIVWHDDAGTEHHYDFLPGALRASLITKGGALSRFDFDLLNADSPDVSGARVQLHLRQDPKLDALDLFVSADDVHIAPALKPAFGSDIDAFQVDALVSPGTSFDSLLSGRADWRAAAENWRLRKGGMLVKGLKMRWGQLAIAGKGALTIDALHRPAGALRLNIADWQALLGEARQRGWIKGANDGLSAGFLAYAEQSQPANAPLDTVLGFQDGILFVGPVPADLLTPLY